MKNFIIAFSSVLCVYWSVTFVTENNARTELMKLEVDILHDQISDMSFQNAQLLSRKTYEDGVADGFANSKSLEYVRGYHAGTAIAVPTENNLLTTK